jgi:hypothetical protein
MYPESSAEKTENIGDVKCCLVNLRGQAHRYWCGYVIFDKKPLTTNGYWGFPEEIPAHGGLTYAKEREDGSYCYGFDCGHDGDFCNSKLLDTKWLMQHCKDIAKWITDAIPFDKQWNETDSKDEQKNIVKEYRDLIGEDYRFEGDSLAHCIERVFNRF